MRHLVEVVVESLGKGQALGGGGALGLAPDAIAELCPQHGQLWSHGARVGHGEPARPHCRGVADAAVGFGFHEIDGAGQAREVVGHVGGIACGVARHTHAEADEVVGVDGPHQVASAAVAGVEQLIETTAIIEDHGAPRSVLGNLFVAWAGKFAVFARGGEAPRALGRVDRPVAPGDPFSPEGIVGAAAVARAPERFPSQVIGHDRVVFRQSAGGDDFAHFLPLEIHGVPWPHIEVYFQPVRAAADHEVDQISLFERRMFEKGTDGVQSDLFEACQIALDHVGVVGLGSHPVVEVAEVLRARAAGGHVVDSVDIPRRIAEVELALLGAHELRRGRRALDAHLVLQAVDHRAVGSGEGDRDGHGVRGVGGDLPGGLDRARLTWGQFDLPRLLPDGALVGIARGGLNDDRSGLASAIDRRCPHGDRLAAERGVVPRSAFIEEDALEHATGHLGEPILGGCGGEEGRVGDGHAGDDASLARAGAEKHQ